MHEDDKLGICRIPCHCDWRTVRTCHSEPVRTTFVGISIEFQAAHRHTGVLTCHFPKFIHEKWCFYPGDCHTSDIGHWFAMTGSSIPHPSARQIPICRIIPISITATRYPCSISTSGTGRFTGEGVAFSGKPRTHLRRARGPFVGVGDGIRTHDLQCHKLTR